MAHVGQECLLLPAGLDCGAERLGHLLDLLLVIDLLRSVHKCDHKTSQSRLLFLILNLQYPGVRNMVVSLLFPLDRFIGRDPDQVCLASYGSAVLLDRLHRGQHLFAQRDQVDGGKIESDVAQRPPYILVFHVEFRRDVFRELADIQVSVNHDDTDKRRRQEVGHIVVEGRELVDLGLIF